MQYVFEIRVDGKVRVNVVNTAAAALSDVKLKVGGSPVMNGVVRDLSYDLNKVVPLTTSYLGNYIDIDKLHLTSKSTTFVSFILPNPILRANPNPPIIIVSYPTFLCQIRASTVPARQRRFGQMIKAILAVDICMMAKLSIMPKKETFSQNHLKILGQK